MKDPLLKQIEDIIRLGYKLEIEVFAFAVMIKVSKDEFEHTSAIPLDHHMDRLAEVIKFNTDKVHELKYG